MSLVKVDIKDTIIWINADQTRFYYNQYQFGRDREFENGQFRYECKNKDCPSAITSNSK
jgi:hypothetical protein